MGEATDIVWEALIGATVTPAVLAVLKATSPTGSLLALAFEIILTVGGGALAVFTFLSELDARFVDRIGLEAPDVPQAKEYVDSMTWTPEPPVLKVMVILPRKASKKEWQQVTKIHSRAYDEIKAIVGENAVAPPR